MEEKRRKESARLYEYTVENTAAMLNISTQIKRLRTENTSSQLRIPIVDEIERYLYGAEIRFGFR